MLISQLEEGQEGGGGQEGGYLKDVGGFLTGHMEDSVIPDVMNDVFYPQEFDTDNFVLISRLDVCQEGGNLEENEGS